MKKINMVITHSNSLKAGCSVTDEVKYRNMDLAVQALNSLVYENKYVEVVDIKIIKSFISIKIQHTIHPEVTKTIKLINID